MEGRDGGGGEGEGMAFSDDVEGGGTP